MKTNISYTVLCFVVIFKDLTEDGIKGRRESSMMGVAAESNLILSVGLLKVFSRFC